MTVVQNDLVIIGGGIAGLWLLNRLRNEGYSAILLESEKLGSGQSIASQGMIHGGLKYALGGTLTGASESIADMPAHWKKCLAGVGDVDLRQTGLLSDAYYLWPRDSMRSRFNAFLGSKAVRGKATNVAPGQWPDFFKGNIKGPLYRLHDIVLDVPSLLANLSGNCRDWIHQVDKRQLDFTVSADKVTTSISADLQIESKRLVCTAGAGNEALLSRLGSRSVSMQRRPLQMVIVKHNYSAPLYVHCVSDQLTATPELTITSHPCSDGSTAWYLGGELAETGALLDQAAQLAAARAKLSNLFPWCDFNNAQWHSFFIDRAEALQPGGKRPDNCSIESENGIYYCWPTKLTLAPNLANRVLMQLHKEGIKPQGLVGQPLRDLPLPGIATPPWEFP